MGEPARQISSQNSNEELLKRPWLKPWQKGQSGNPGGRPKDADRVAQYIRDQTKGGREIVDCVLKIMRRQEDDVQHKDVLKASEFLWDRGLGKPAEINPILSGLPLESLSEEELKTLAELLRKLGSAQPPGSGIGAEASKAS